MNRDILASLGSRATAVVAKSPCTNVYGLARTILACGTLLTLLANTTDTLFAPSAGTSPPPQCSGAAGISIYCVAPSLEFGRWVSVAILVAAASGFYPRWTALPHWYVAFSLQGSGTTLDGGDQVAAVLSLLIVPVALCDSRRTHWDPPREMLRLTHTAWLSGFVAYASIVVIRLQAAILYFQAGTAKFGVHEWADGTAMYYWLTDDAFGAPPWIAWAFEPILHNGTLLTLFTWSVMVGEVALALALIVPSKYWKYFLVAAVLFHVGIALVIGLLSFACSMIALDVIFLHACQKPLHLPTRVQSKLRKTTATERAVEPIEGPIEQAVA